MLRYKLIMYDTTIIFFLFQQDHLHGVMVRMFSFESSRYGKTNAFLTHSQDNVSEDSDISIYVSQHYKQKSNSACWSYSIKQTQSSPHKTVHFSCQHRAKKQLTECINNNHSCILLQKFKFKKVKAPTANKYFLCEIWFGLVYGV